MIKEINCDLLKANVESIGSCNNCFKTHGSGVAKSILNEYPEALEADIKYPLSTDARFGRACLAHVNSNIIRENKSIHYVFLLFGQYNYGGHGRFVNYEKIFTSLEECKNIMKTYNIKSLGLPYGMGAVRAGGDWRIIRAMIESAFENSGIDVYICKF